MSPTYVVCAQTPDARDLAIAAELDGVSVGTMRFYDDTRTRFSVHHALIFELRDQIGVLEARIADRDARLLRAEERLDHLARRIENRPEDT